MSKRRRIIATQKWRLILAPCLLALPYSLPAHHSRANFQLDNLVEMRGTVTDFKWANPHIYWEMELEDCETWLTE